MRSLTFFVIALFLGAGFALADEHIVDQKRLRFTPNKITIKAGDTIVFKNSDRTAHQITAKAGMTANSPLLPPKKDFKLDFPAAGTFTIGCHIHPRMKLEITVK
ncbi:MAG: cupredoxin domain-containing protein [Methyloligellaceae bacterium]